MVCNFWKLNSDRTLKEISSNESKQFIYYFIKELLLIKKFNLKKSKLSTDGGNWTIVPKYLDSIIIIIIVFNLKTMIIFY